MLILRNIEPSIEMHNQMIGIKVRLRNNPGRIGELSGRKREGSGFILLEVIFGPNDRQYIRETQLESVPKHEDMWDLFRSQRFGRPSDLARIVITEKLKGDLTNVFYSMEVGNTDFMPHQFKPVLKFIESQRGRLLIADEVGLGKTIEAIYIWKELQAREAARCCLVVCPAMLREKWVRDFDTRFNIEAEIVDASKLIETIEAIRRNPRGKSMILVTSLEGIRAKDEAWDSESTNTRKRLGGLLEEMADRSTEYLFDLVIIDEAHYLRNPSTASHQIARLLRDNSGSFILLSATPIQTSDENLYNLLALLSPEDYSNYSIFMELINSNSKLIHLENLIKYKGNAQRAKELLSDIINHAPFLIDEYLVNDLKKNLSKDFLSYEERIDLSRKIAERSFYSRYINRTRKRDVIENRVIRESHTFTYSFTEEEQSIYNSVTEQLRHSYSLDDDIANFVLIARQRQMTSSLPAAFKQWSSHDNQKGLDELLWDNFRGITFFENKQMERSFDFSSLPPIEKIGYLENIDSKYTELKTQLNILISREPGEKVVVFSFYRETIAYLKRRLTKEGLHVVSIIGGMSAQEKYSTIDGFSNPTGPNILISSEVGSEGIDLQFCHIIINYDLPWNPMRLEQRIGRIDRIGQKSDKIYIYNIACKDTIEDRVLMRLYERIHIFKESIGDLEDILGDTIDRLALDLINPSLTDEEREYRMEQNALRIIEDRQSRNELEEKAIDFFGFSDYILRSISDAHELDRFIGPSDTLRLVDDFFSSQYPGTRIIPYSDFAARLIRLSARAKEDLAEFIEKTKPQALTRLHRSEDDILCMFDAKEKCYKGIQSIEERIDAIHPLIQWIVSENDKNYTTRHPCSAIMLSLPISGIPQGCYVYFIQLWSAIGWKSKKLLRFFAAPIDGKTLDFNDAERLVVAAFRDGKYWNSWEESDVFSSASTTLDALADNAFSFFNQFQQEFISENVQICEQQLAYIRRTAECKISELQTLINRLVAQDKTRTIKAHEGRIKKVRELLKIQEIKIEKHRDTSSQVTEIAIGIIQNGV